MFVLAGTVTVFAPTLRAPSEMVAAVPAVARSALIVVELVMAGPVAGSLGTGWRCSQSQKCPSRRFAD